MTEEMHVNWGAEQLASERTLPAAEAVYSPSEPRAQARDAQVQVTTTGHRIACLKAGGANRLPRETLMATHQEFRRKFRADYISASNQERTANTKRALSRSATASHQLPLDQAPDAYETFGDRRTGRTKVVLRPSA